MSIVLEALEKAQKEKSKLADIPVIQVPQKIVKPELAVKSVRRHRPKKIFFVLFIPVIYLLFLGWWLNFNNAVVYEDKSHNSQVPAHRNFQVPTSQDIQIPTQPGFLLDTTPEETVDIDLPPINVTGVVWDEKDPIVLANSRFLKKGDEIMGAKIVGIQLHKVKFLYKDKEFAVSVE